ncbi:serine/threonine-protein kinase tousled-like 2 isoform X1 [Diadema antillarum]|uniref:serine/threonine-protein kinase tousled-like 2 isoform X1 n=1 Tax=Diadema antillarum TaxID=105358 RepID=UPI003A8C80C5
MQEFRHFDPQKLELLEARIKGNRSSQQPILITDDSNHSTSSRGSPNDEGEVVLSETPEKEKKRRKRKGAPDGDQGGAKKISEYFRSTTSNSPGRANSGLGVVPKSPPASVFPSQLSSSPCSNSNDFTNLSTHSPKTQRARPVDLSSSATQTDMSFHDLEQKERQHQTELRLKEETIETLNSTTQELTRRLETAQKLLEKVKEQSKRSTEKIKSLLIEKAKVENKDARTRSMEDRLRLGQFTTQRQGAKFVEAWNDGYAFADLIKRQEGIAKEREELDQQKKSLMKRKPPNSPHPGGKSRPKQNGPDEAFAKPLPEFMNHVEFYERDEILKLRQSALKKEEADLQAELEKLERERNLHIRELKRIHNEDQSAFRDHRVLNDRYLLLRLLGKGGFSEVYKGYDLREHRDVACKIHQLSKEWKEDKKANYIKHALREYEIHKSLDHMRIVKLYDVFEIDSNSFCTVLEFCPGNDLDFHLKQHKLMPEREARCIIMQVVSALKYLNERKPPIIHYDLKPGNILLCHGSTCGAMKITDFGLSKVMDEEHFNSQEGGMDLTSQGAGTYWYLPPECFVVGKEPPKISSKVDVWSVGIIFYQCLYGKKPFGHNLSQASILEQNTILRATQVQFSPKPTVSQEAKDFIRRCLMYRKEDRADVLALAKDVYLMPSSKKNSAAAAALATSTSSPSSQSMGISENST